MSAATAMRGWARAWLTRLGLAPFARRLRTGVRRLQGPGGRPERAAAGPSDIEYLLTAAQLDREFYLGVYLDVKQAGMDPVHHYIAFGHREGRNPSPVFATEHYKREHGLGVDSNPLVHQGLELIRNPRSFDGAAPPRAEEGTLTAAAYRLQERSAAFGAETRVFDFVPLDPQRPLILLVVFCQEETLTDLQRSICRDYLATGANLVVLLNQTLRIPPAEAGVPAGVHKVICRENAGFDFASWHEAHRLLGPLQAHPRVILTNDSLIPVSGGGLAEFVQTHTRAEADWLFSTCNHEQTPHGQSFFMSYRPAALGDDAAGMLDHPLFSTKQEVIDEIEIPLAERLREAGTKVGYLFDRDVYRKGAEDLNPSLHSARELVEQGFPFVKAELLLTEMGRMRSWLGEVFDDRRMSEIRRHLDSRYPARCPNDRVGHFVPAGPPGPADRRRRVLLVGHNADVGGAQLLLLTLARALTRVLNYEVVIVLESGGARLDRLRAVAPTFVLDGNEARLHEVLEMCRAHGVERAILNTVVPLRRLEAYYSAGLKVVCLVHEMAPAIRALKVEKDVAQALGVLHRVVYPSEAVRQSVESVHENPTGNSVILSQGHFRLTRSTYLSGTEAGTLPSAVADRKARGDRIVLCVGTLEQRKGFDRFHAVARAYRRAHPETRASFVWVGSPQPVCDVEAVYAKARQDPGILCVPNLDEADLLAVYEAADVYFFASRSDAMPYAVIEALSVGLPVVGYDNVGGCDTLIARFGTLLPRDAGTARCCSALHGYLGRPEDPDAGAARRRHIAATMDFDDYAAGLMALFGDHNPRVCVAVPNYQHEDFLPVRLTSILEQDYKYLNLLLLDDKSGDGSIAVLDRYRTLFAPFTRAVYNETNSGNSYLQWQKAVEQADGDLLWIAESDDACARSFLRHMIGAFADPQVVMGYGQTDFIDEDGLMFGAIQKDFRWIHPFMWNHSYRVPGRDEIRRALSRANTIINVSSVLFRRSAIPPLDRMLRFRFAGDWELYLQTCMKGDIFFERQARNYFRRSKNAQTSRVAYSDLFYREHNAIMRTVNEIAGPEAAAHTAETIRRHFSYRPVEDRPVEHYLDLED